jgi:hypothetical protein
MTSIEHDIRSHTHVSHMKIQSSSLERRESRPTPAAHQELKSLWTVLDSNEIETRGLYVFSGPGRLAGTTLLLRDRIGSLDNDAMWLYLRGFDSFTKIESTARRRTVVPGTSLTYEDAKGFISVDKYGFSFAAEPPTEGFATIVACPATLELASDLGYGALTLQVDLEKKIVLAIDYQDLAGKPLKKYRVEKRQQVENLWLPKRVLLTHLANGTRTLIEYDHWLPATSPPEGLFTPGTDEESFRVRILHYLTSLGLDAPIRAELAKSDAGVQRWNEKWGHNPREHGDAPR